MYILTNVNNTKFIAFTLLENELILKFGKKRERSISFSELDKIYIKLYRLNPIMKFIGFISPFILIFIVIQYFPIPLILITTLFTILPVFLFVLNYKRYQLYVRLKDGTLYSKRVSVYKKAKDLSILKRVV